MQLQLDLYDQIALIVCGLVAITAARIGVTGDWLLLEKDISIGTFGAAIVYSYVAGHLIQAIGSVLDRGFWGIQGGQPTHWIWTPKSAAVISNDIKKAVIHIGWPEADQQVKPKVQDSTLGFHRIRSLVGWAKPEAYMLRKFQSNYGLFRGLTAAFLLTSIVSLLYRGVSWDSLFFFLLAAVSAWRMRRWGIQYARELFLLAVRPSDIPKVP